MSNQTKTCGRCEHFVKDGGDDVKKGDCYFWPPTQLEKIGKVRPKVYLNERACGQFKALPDGVQAEERVKYEAPTPAYLADKGTGQPVIPPSTPASAQAVQTPPQPVTPVQTHEPVEKRRRRQ